MRNPEGLIRPSTALITLGVNIRGLQAYQATRNQQEKSLIPGLFGGKVP